MRTSLVLVVAFAILSGCGNDSGGNTAQTSPAGGSGSSATGGSSSGTGGAGAAGATAASGASGTSSTGGAGGTVSKGGSAGMVSTGGAGGTVSTGGAGGMVAAGGAGGVVVAGAGGAIAAGGSAGATTMSTWQICDKPGDCLLEPTGCCGYPCGLTHAGDADAVDYQQTAAQAKDTCTSPMPCPPKCAPQVNADLAAFCRNKTCSVVEVSKDPVSSCAGDGDCVLHLAQCCDCGTGTIDQYVALNGKSVADYEAQVCGPNVGGCALGCAGMHPANVSATCSLGQCKVTMN